MHRKINTFLVPPTTPFYGATYATGAGAFHHPLPSQVSLQAIEEMLSSHGARTTVPQSLYLSSTPFAQDTELVCWTAEGCYACERMKAIIEAADIPTNCAVSYADAADDPEVTAVPTLVLNRGGERVKRHVGVVEDIEKWVASEPERSSIIYVSGSDVDEVQDIRDRSEAIGVPCSLVDVNDLTEPPVAPISALPAVVAGNPPQVYDGDLRDVDAVMQFISPSESFVELPPMTNCMTVAPACDLKRLSEKWRIPIACLSGAHSPLLGKEWNRCSTERDAACWCVCPDAEEPSISVYVRGHRHEVDATGGVASIIEQVVSAMPQRQRWSSWLRA